MNAAKEYARQHKGASLTIFVLLMYMSHKYMGSVF